MKKVKIGNKNVGKGELCLISLEPSATFTGFDEAKKMIKATAEAGADAVKFQTFVTGEADRMMAMKDITVDFSTPSGKKQEFVYDALKRRELTRDEWTKLVEYAKKLNILFITAAYFPETVKFLEEIKVDAIKVSKGDINNVLLIDSIAKTKLPVILDGREKFEDVEKAIEICKKNKNDQIIIMHCPSGYPAENAGVHLSAITAIQERYPYPVGFADHSRGSIMNYAAVALGVSILEKTITTDKTIEHAEHYMSLELDELKNMINNVRAVEQAIGTPEILKTSRVQENARRCLVAKKLIKKGDKITMDIIDYKRPGNAGISCSEGFNVLNKHAVKDIPDGTFLQWDLIE